jgi:hypothetical protein
MKTVSREEIDQTMGDIKGCEKGINLVLDVGRHQKSF